MAYRGRGQGVGMGRRGIGPTRKCKCPMCGYEAPHTPGIPCANQICAKCNVRLIGVD
jgi:hypothetical protein